MKKKPINQIIPNDDLKRVCAYQTALIKQNQIDKQTLEKQIKELNAEKTAIKNSISFLIGSYITAPFRFIYRNFIAKKQENINPIIATCDSALSYINLLEVRGWALSDSDIEQIEVFADNISLGFATLGLHRNDVKLAFEQNNESLYAGFSFKFKENIKSDSVRIVITDSNKNTLTLYKIIIPSYYDMSLNAKYQIFLSQEPNNPIEYSSQKFSYNPLISIIVPVYNIDSKWLDLCIQSVLKQDYNHWELCLYDDKSTNIDTLDCLSKWENKDARIKIKFGQKNLGISLASNKAIEMAKGDYIGLLDHDDELRKCALYMVVESLNKGKDYDLIYSDEDKISKNGNYCDPHFKSDFNLDTLLAHNYICHFSVIKKSIGDHIGWFRHGYEGAQDHDLILRVVATTQNIYHIPKVLYHWRKVEGSTAITTGNKSYAHLAGKKAVADYLKSKNIKARVVNGLYSNSYRVKRKVDTSELISIIVPFKDKVKLLEGCIYGLLNKTKYTNIEILLINNNSTEEDTLTYCNRLIKKYKNIKLYAFDEPFNFSKLNNFAVSKANGSSVLFLNNDIEVTHEDWLCEMVSHIQRSEVGAVGAKLLYSDNTIQHAGLVVNQECALHINKGLMDLEIGYFHRANHTQNISACTAACLLVDKSLFLQVGGFDSDHFAIAYNDVDLCLKIRQAGYLITYTPFAKLYHYESQSRGLDNEPTKLARFSKEIKCYQEKWGEHYKNGDPYLNPNLAQSSEVISLNIK